MRLHRFYILQPLGEVVVINDGLVLKQWKNVFRYTPGVSVIIFNGDGYDYTYEIESITSKECKLNQLKRSSSYIPDRKITLYLSLIKKDNFELVTQKITELGINTIVPVISERSEKKNLNIERLQKIVIEAGEQCGRGDITTISPIISLNEALNTVSKESFSLCLQMGGKYWKNDDTWGRINKETSLNIFIGPEGGWSEKEENLFDKNKITKISLGKTVLRAETAAIVACGIVSL